MTHLVSELSVDPVPERPGSPGESTSARNETFDNPLFGSGQSGGMERQEALEYVAEGARVVLASATELVSSSRPKNAQARPSGKMSDIRENLAALAALYCRARFEVVSTSSHKSEEEVASRRFDRYMKMRTGRGRIQAAVGWWWPTKSGMHAAAEYYVMETLWYLFIKVSAATTADQGESLAFEIEVFLNETVASNRNVLNGIWLDGGIARSRN